MRALPPTFPRARARVMHVPSRRPPNWSPVAPNWSYLTPSIESTPDAGPEHLCYRGVMAVHSWRREGAPDPLPPCARCGSWSLALGTVVDVLPVPTMGKLPSDVMPLCPPCATAEIIELLRRLALPE